MKHDVLVAMTDRELEDYARCCGIDIAGAGGRDEKVAAIERGRQRVASLRVLGLDLEIPVRKLRDKNLNDLLKRRSITDEQADALMLQLLGEEQSAKLMERVTDEDGVVDVDAYSMVIARILTDGDLKNF